MLKDIKKKVLGDLSGEMRKTMGEGYKDGLKDKLMKVTIAGDSEESIEKGLDKAKEIMKKKLGEEFESESMLNHDDCENESPEELKSKIEELQKKLKSLEQ